MSRQIWSREKILEEIMQLYASGYDITQSRMEALDSRLTSAAIRYFGSWRAAVEAAGIDYEGVAALGKRRRAEKITKWTRETILEEIRRLHGAGEDLTSTNVRSKYLSLYATARRPDHFGSWANALSEAGIDYAALKKDSRAKRRGGEDWKEQLLADYEREDDPRRGRMKASRAEAGEPSAKGNWARELVRERLAELYEREPVAAGDSQGSLLKRLQALLHRRGRKPAGTGDGDRKQNS